MIVDSQVHLWPANVPERPWPSDRKAPRSGQAQYLPDELIPQMDSVGVDAAVIVPPIWAGDDNEVPLAWCREHRGRLGVMGRLDLWQPDAAEKLRDLAAQPEFLGLRLSYPQHRGFSWLDVEEFGWFWSLAEQLELPVMVLLQGLNVTELRPVAERYPGLTLILDHMGLVIGDPVAVDPFLGQDEVVSLAKLPNVHVKLSALPEYTIEAFPFPSLTDVIKRVFDAYGPRRLAWGSDLTRITRASYGEVLSHVRDHLAFLDPEDKEWILGRTISSLLHWPAEDAAADHDGQSHRTGGQQ